jgi:asparagine synthetase B (glutamine-hydrolysing)
MAYIVGTIRYPDLECDRKTVEAALRSFGIGNGLQTVVDIPGCCLGIVSPAHDRPSHRERIASTGNSALMWTGYISDLDRIRGQVMGSAADLNSDSTDAQILLDAYLRFGIEILQGLNGLYSIVVWDEKRKRLTSITDRHGFTKLYYWKGKSGLVFASECKAIIGHPLYRKAMDIEGVINFLGSGYCFGQRTLFKDIHLIPQGCAMTYEGQKVSFNSYWEYNVRPAADSFDELTERLYQTLGQAFHEAVGNERRVVIPVSGGLDSRTMAGLAARSGLQIFGFTIGSPGSRDLRFGRRIGKKVCFYHETLPLATDYIAQYGPEGTALMDGLVATHPFFLLKLLRVKRASDILITGFLGDILTGSDVTNETLSPEQMLRRKFLFGFGSEELINILKPSLRSLSRTNESYLTNSMEAINASDPRDKAWFCLLKERQRRYVSTVILSLRRHWHVVAPMANSAFVDFMLSIPTKFREEQLLYRNMIRVKLPAVACVPDCRKNAYMVSTPWSWRWQYVKSKVPVPILQSAALIGDRLETLLSNSSLAERAGLTNRNIVTTRFDDVIRFGSREYFQDLFSERERIADIFDLRSVSDLFEAHMGRKINAWHKICFLGALIEWRRQFEI